MLRLSIALLALLATAPLAAAACPAPLECALEADANDGAAASAGLADVAAATAWAHPPAGPGAPVTGAALERYQGETVEEAVVAFAIDCSHTAEEGCTPLVFVGSHFAAPGHDLRAGAGTASRSASFSYEGDVEGHTVLARAGTFYFWNLQYGYFDVYVDGMGHGEFGAIPTLFL